MPQDMLKLESRDEALAPTHRFLGRIAISLFSVAIIIAASLAIGIWGYCRLEGMNLIDGFLNASMILAGMGPVNQLHTAEGKIFAGCFAIYSGLMLIAATGIVLAPVVHRFLHKFHIDAEND